MQLINRLVGIPVKKRIPSIRHYMDHPAETQDHILHNLLETARYTEFGIKYDFRNIRTAKNYRERVPIQEYDQLKVYVDRLLKGEQNLLWPSEIKWFAKSSGTTSDRSKFIPVSHESLKECHYKGIKDFFAIYHNNNPDTKVLKGKNLTIGGSHEINQLNENSSYGDLSAVLLQNLPKLTQIFRTPTLDIALMDDFEKKIDLMAKTTLKENVISIAGVPTWTLVLIKRLFEITGKSKMTDIWSELELYIHGGVNFTPYIDQFKRLIPSSSMKYYEVYNASEGFFGFQIENGANDMLLMLNNGIYYEFIPMNELENEFPKVCSLSDVKINENYALVISTNAGLWRYLIGDTIRFTSTAPYKIQVSGRIKHFINAFGEEVIVENADNAVAKACKETGAIVTEYTAAPVYFSENNNGRHEWLIEFEKEPEDMEKFTVILDEALQSFNSDYEAKRYKGMALKIPLVQKLEKGVFYRWMESKNKLGGQHKVPRLSNDRKYVEEILKMV